MSGKGSARRPRFVPLHEYAANHERTFGAREREARAMPAECFAVPFASTPDACEQLKAMHVAAARAMYAATQPSGSDDGEA